MEPIDNNAKYWAFISYSQKDKAWGDWLHRRLEAYGIPKHLVGTVTSEGNIPKQLLPIFRDREELPTSADLGNDIQQALKDSRCLIVICSPHSANSFWVNEEIRRFKAMGKSHRVHCLIVDGEPNASNTKGEESEECFPCTIRFQVDAQGELTDIPAEPMAADVRPGKDGKVNGLLKLIAGITGLDFDTLKQRHKQRQKQRRNVLLATAFVAISILMLLTSQWFFQRQAAQLALAEKLAASGVVALQRGDITTGVAQLSAVVGQAQDELAYLPNVIDFWLARLKSYPLAVKEVTPVSVIRWRGRNYFHSKQGQLLLLPDGDLINWGVNFEQATLYALIEQDADNWVINTYDVRSFALQYSTAFEALLAAETKILQLPESDGIYIESYTQSSYAGGSSYVLKKFQDGKLQPVINEGDKHDFFIADECDRFLNGNKIRSFQNLNKYQDVLSYNPYQDKHKNYTRQFDQQGFVLIYSMKYHELYAQIIEEQGEYKLQRRWHNLTLSEQCNGYRIGQSLFSEEETGKPAVTVFHFPYFYPESSMWNSSSFTDTEAELALYDSDGEYVEYDITTSHLMRQKLADIEGRIKDAQSEDFEMLYESRYLKIKEDGDDLLIIGEMGSGNFRDYTICRFNQLNEGLQGCTKVDVHAEAYGPFLLPDVQYMVLPNIKFMGYESFHLLDLSTLTLITPNQTPAFIEGTEFAFNADKSRMAISSADEIWSYQRSSEKSSLTLVEKINLDSDRALPSASTERLQETPYYQSKFVGDTSLFLDRDTLVMQLMDGSVQARNLITGLITWYLPGDEILTTGQPLNMLTDINRQFLVLFNQQGLRLVHMPSGTPLTESVLFSEIGIPAPLTVAPELEDYEYLYKDIDIDKFGNVSLVNGDKQWYRAAPTNSSQHQVFYTARTGPYGNKAVQELPIQVGLPPKIQ
ncbi:MAG: toll/interleukin-1 receptor domain-containing protein [Colwellia sp.]